MTAFCKAKAMQALDATLREIQLKAALDLRERQLASARAAGQLDRDRVRHYRHLLATHYMVEVADLFIALEDAEERDAK